MNFLRRFFAKEKEKWHGDQTRGQFIVIEDGIEREVSQSEFIRIIMEDQDAS